MIDSVLVKQFKCLRDVRVELGAFTVLIGPNDSGKSSFLEALRLPGRAAVQGVADSAFEVTVRARGRNLAVASDGSGATTSTVSPDLPGGVMALTRELPDLFAISEPVRLDARAIAGGGPRGAGALAKLIESREAGVSSHLVRIATGTRTERRRDDRSRRP